MSTVLETMILSAVDARIHSMFLEAKGNMPKIASKLVLTKATDRPYEVFNRFVGVGAAGVVDENAIYPSKEIKQFTPKTVDVLKFGFRVDVSRESVVDNMFTPIASSVARAMRNSMDQTQELRILNLLNNGFGTTTSADGGYLFASHTLAQGGTQSNYASTATALDVDSLWSAINTIKTSVSNSGLYDSIHVPKYLVVPQALERMATELMKSQFIPFKLENQVNALEQLYPMEVLTSPLLSSSTAWFLIADPSQLSSESLVLIQREVLTQVAV